MAYLCETRHFILRSQGFQAWSKSTIPVPVTFAVVSVPVGVGGGAVTGSAGPVPSIVTHGTRIGPIATAIGAGVRAGAASVAIVVHRVVVVVQPRRSGAVVRGLKYAIFSSSYRKNWTSGLTHHLHVPNVSVPVERAFPIAVVVAAVAVLSGSVPVVEQSRGVGSGRAALARLLLPIYLGWGVLLKKQQ